MRKTRSPVSDEEFMHIIETAKSLQEAADVMGITQRAMMYRRRNTEERMGITIKAPNPKVYIPSTSERVTLDGTVVIFSDWHIWPGQYTDAFWMLLKIVKEIQPALLIANGDIIDGARISRHPRIGWAETPSVKDEIEAAKEQMGMIHKAAPKAKRLWTWGNHDRRFDSFLSSNAAEIEGVKGTRLGDHFPDWTFCESITLNETVVVKHRFRGGVHAAYNNALHGGVTMITGHTHRLMSRPLSNYRGTHYGIEGGCMADPHGPQFAYVENAPVNWQPGFVVLHLDGERVVPELVEVRNASTFFGGKRWELSRKPCPKKAK